MLAGFRAHGPEAHGFQSAGPKRSSQIGWMVAISPPGCIAAACVPGGTIGHHRDYARAVCLPGAHKGMFKVAEVQAPAAVELFLNAPLLRKAKAAFKANRKGKKYDLPTPKRIVPVNYGTTDA